MLSVVVDPLSGRQILAGPEERDATQPLIFYLTQQLGWNPKQLMAHPQWRVPKSPSASRSGGYPVDLAIFDSPQGVGDPRHIRIIAECKAPTVEEGIDQLKTYLSLEPEARLGIWFNGERHCIVYKLPDRFVVNELGVIPRPSAPLTPSEAEPPLRHKDLQPPPNMGEVFRDLRDKIASQDTHVNRDEFILNDLANLLICKIVDEQLGELDRERHLAFQPAGSAADTGYAIREFFKQVRGRLPSVFTDDSETLHVDDGSLQTVVRTLCRFRLLGFDRHAVGTAFQVLRGRALKGEEGAYFTPPPLVNCVVELTNPTHNTRLIDPACGTGGFLAAALDHVFEGIDSLPEINELTKAQAKKDWAQDLLFAADKDVVSTKLCKAYLTLLGDGRAHVYRANAIDRAEWSGRADDLARQVASGKFSLVMMNPPFGQDLTVSADVGRQEGLVTSRRWARGEDGNWAPGEAYAEEQLGIAFFERGMDLLTDGGQLAIVLPETFLFSNSYRWFVDMIADRYTITHIVDVPMVAFEEFCRAKTCLVFVRKTAPTPGHEIIMSYPRSIGTDKRGNPLYALNAHGHRSGPLDNEMATATQEILAQEYRPGRKRNRRSESRLCFRVKQKSARLRGVLVPRFWWREDVKAALAEWRSTKPSELVTLGELADSGVVMAFEGHGSPPGNARATGDVPYVKVTDLKNWRINENPTNFVHESVANRLRRGGVTLEYGDLLTPSRASSNIGQFSLVLPWQTNVLLTKEMLGLRVLPNERQIDGFLLLALMSLKVVQDQYKTLALMQTNREHLGNHWREVMLPIPTDPAARALIADSTRSFFEGIIKAHEALADMSSVIDPSHMGSRP